MMIFYFYQFVSLFTFTAPISFYFPISPPLPFFFDCLSQALIKYNIKAFTYIYINNMYIYLRKQIFA